MSRRVRILAMAATLAAVAIGVGGISILRLYQVALTQQRERLVEVAQGRSRLIEAIARFDAAHGSDFPGGPTEATLSQIRDAHEHFAGFGRTGEFVLARREGDQIVFLLRHRGGTVDAPAPVPFASSLAEPMRRAVRGETGTVVGLDYRGVRVLAAYEPVSEIGAGLVVKIDLAEVRAPYVTDAAIAGAIGLLLVFLGVVLTRALGGTLVKELEHAEAGERRHLEWLDLAMRAGGLGAFDLDMASGRIEPSPELLSLLGYEADDVVSTLEWWSDRLHPEDRPEAQVALARYASASDPGPARTVRVRDAAERYRFLLVATGVVERNADHGATRLVGVAVDVTSLEVARQALAARDAHLRSAQEVGRIGSWEWSAEDGASWWSDEMYRIVGKTPGEVEPGAEAFLEAVVEADRRVVLELAERTFEKGERREREFRIAGSDGAVRRYHAVALPTFDEGGRVVRVMGLVQDVTEASTSEEMLRQAQKMEVVGVLTGGVAHDFNNVLTTILANADLALAALHDRKSSFESLTEVRAAAHLGAELIRQLMAFSRQQPLELRVTDVHEVLGGTGRMLHRLLPTSIAVTLRCDAGVPHIRADAAALQQVILNLATNARDAMPSGGELSIECGTGDSPEGPALVIRMRDTGSGMDTATLSRMFQPFFTTKGSAGTGLGLAMVRALVERQKGTVHVDSVEGVGTTFTLTFPGVDEPIPERKEPLAVVTPGGTRTRILVVEDEDAIRRAASRILARAGYEVISAGDGREALALMEKADGIGLVVTDMMMPLMGGVQLFRAMESHTPRPRFLLTSGYSLTELQAGADAVDAHFLRKPWDASELLAAVRFALEGPASKKELAIG